MVSLTPSRLFSPPVLQGLGDKLPSEVTSLLGGEGVKAAFAIWTTTPWTIPANLAVAVNADLDYCLVKAEVSPRPYYGLGPCLILPCLCCIAPSALYTRFIEDHCLLSLNYLFHFDFCSK